jgi:Fe-Mn family superoxide dismutase
MLKRASATRPLLASAPTALRFGASSTSSSGALVGGAAKWKVLSSSASMQRRSIHKLPELSWLEQPSALNTCFSEETLTQHIKKHHLAHLQATNKLIEGTELEKLPLEDLIVKVSKDKKNAALLNHASEAWNHEFFFKCMSPNPSTPSPSLINSLELHFGGLEQFKTRFEQFATVHLGSGWTWLVDRDGHMEVINTSNTNTVIADPQYTPLLVLDLWEHSYFLDYRENRKEYVTHWWKVVNWKFVAEQLREAEGKNSWMQPGQGLTQYPASA